MNSSSTKTILILTANPINTERLRLDEEVRKIQERLRQSRNRDQFEVVAEWAVTTDALRFALLNHHPHIVHFSGHGAGEQGLALENDDGQVHLVSARSLANLFKHFANQVECVILNACYSEVQALAIAQHIGRVVGMSQAIGDTAARKFAIGFYDGLGAGWTYEASYELGCNAIDMEGIPEDLTPVLRRKSDTSPLPVPPPEPQPNLLPESELKSTPTDLLSSEPIEVFFSYSHKDEELRDELATHLAMLKNQGLIKAWHDREISAGDEWADEIDQYMNSAQVILLLVSANFLASSYCYSIEMKRAMERHEAKEARVIPIILKPVDWNGAPFGKLQALPKNAKPVTTWANQDEAFAYIAQAIRKVVGELKTPQLAGSRRSLTIESQPVSTPTQISEPSPSTPAQLTRELVELDARSGKVPIDSPFYIERPPIESQSFQAIAKPGALLLIKAPRQMGKSSLMTRIMHHAKSQYGYRYVHLPFQDADEEVFENLETFLKWFCSTITYELNLEDKVEDYWKGVLAKRQKCSNYIHRYLLPQLDSPLVLGMDEVDLLFENFDIAREFFPMLRTWNERSKDDPTWQKLSMVITHSQEVYISLDINQSPFNVGQTFQLPEFNRSQVEDLVRRHGLEWASEEVDQLMGLADGHPYLLRTGLYEIASGNMTLERFLELAPTEEGPFRNHLRLHLSNLKDPRLRSALKRVVTSDRPVELESEQQFKLCSMGLTELRGNAVIPLCPLYRIYFKNRLRDD